MKRTISILILLAILFACEKNSPPSCELVSHEIGAEIIQGEAVTFIVDAADPDGSVTKVRLYIDDVLLETVEELPYAFSWDTDGADLGCHVISAVAIDNDNGEGETSIEIQIVGITVDEEDPIVEFITPVEDATESETINIIAKAMDNVGVEYVDFMIKEENWVVFAIDSTPAFFEYSATLNTLNYPDGLIKLSIAAYDGAGNYGKDSVSIFINNSGDTIAPIVEIFAPLNNDTVSQHIVLRAKVTDNVGVDHVDFNIKDGTWCLLDTDYYPIGDNEYAILWDTRDTPDGTYGIEAVAFDAVANKGFDRIGLTVDNSGSRPDNDSFIYEGRKYYFKTIGTQTWMVDNLAYFDIYGYTSIDPAPAVGYYVYGYIGTNGDVARHLDNYEEYGILYNWNAAKNACPEGWHLPSDEEWKTLEMYLGMSASDADVLNWRYSGNVGFKLKSTSGWIDDGNGGNSSGFQAIPGGLKNKYDQFVNLGSQAKFWSSSQDSYGNCIGRCLSGDKDGILKTYFHHEVGASVRCIKDE